MTIEWYRKTHDFQVSAIPRILSLLIWFELSIKYFQYIPLSAAGWTVLFGVFRSVSILSIVRVIIILISAVETLATIDEIISIASAFFIGAGTKSAI